MEPSAAERGWPAEQQATERSPRAKGRRVLSRGSFVRRARSGEKKGKSIEVTPNFLGGTNWMPMSYSQDTSLFYIPSNDWKEDYWTEEVTYKKGAACLGPGFRIKRNFDTHVGALRAVDPATGKIVWEHLETTPDVDQWFLSRVRNGANTNGVTKMPSFEGLMSQEARWAIRAYIDAQPEDD
jgi:glucose dehydrogenase